jgi:hypothetical protein
MTKPFSVLLKSAFTILFACSAVPAFAQHGGGGHMGGGGFHGGGGGGFQGGGGMRSGGGGGPRGGSYSPPAAGYSAPRAAAPSPLRSGGGFVARPGNNYSRPGGNSVVGNPRFGNSFSAPPAVADGRWHSFSGPGGGHGPSGAQSVAGPAGNAGGFHVFSGNRQAGSASTVRSFSGQGGQVWENSPMSRNVVPKSQSLSTIHNSLSGSFARSSAFRSNSVSAPSRIARGSTFATNRGFTGGVSMRNSTQQLGGSPRFGNRHGGFGRGCWDCGFGFGGWGWGSPGGWGWGFGGGWGFGWPWLGFWGWGPSWYDPWWGWPASGYGYDAYPNYNLNVYPAPAYSTPDNNSAPPAQQDNQGNSDGNWVTPNGPSPSAAQNSPALTVPVLIYMKNGAVYSVRDYWMTDGELYYVLMDGAQHSVDLDLVDLSRTNSENAKSGVKFIFKSEPSITTPAPGGIALPPGPSEPSPTPAPTQQINAVSQPEART